MKDRIQQVFKKSGGRPLKAKDVGKALGMSADDRSQLRATLNALVDDGDLVMLEGRRYALPGDAGAVAGTVQRKSTGSAWFIPDDRTVDDAFLPPQEILAVVDGDRVLARIERAPRGPAAKILRIVERRRTTLTGVLLESARARWVEVDDNVLSGPVLIPAGSEGNSELVQAGDVVEVLLVEPPTAVTSAVGRVIRSLGKRGRLDVEIERILAEKRIVKAFPTEVDAEAASFPPNPTEADWAGREDLRALPLVTIDGETAKDFDDAVHAVPQGKDVLVTVAIADVSHYVKTGAPLDVEAARRGTSIYYPGRVVPMLPEALSNGLCSLRPHVDRLCLVAEFAVRPDGSRHKHRFFPAVMKSHARLTYTLAQKFYDGDPDAAKELSPEVQANLRALDEASKRLRAQRSSRGALDFDLPETVIALDDKGEPVKVHALERLNAHKLIEDLMVAANEAVAERFEERAWPSLYRVHEAPDAEKLERFAKLARLLVGKRIPELEGDVKPKGLMAVMKALADHPGKRALDSLLLRSMMQAKYSAQNVGHYGLGSEAYSHFTSPIRRYPDLVVHRLLKERLSGKGRRLTGKKGDEREAALLNVLDDIAVTSSQCERTATEIERAVDALYAAWFMKDRVGEVFDGLVQGVAEFGLFVNLEGVNVEGMVRVADIPGDYWEYDEVRLRLVGQRSGRVYGIGDVLKVKVAAVDIAKRQIALAIEGEAKRDGRPSDWERDDDGRPPRKHGRNAPREDERRSRQQGKRRGKATPHVVAEPARGGREPRARGRGRDEAEAPTARPRITGPEDLRRIFEEKQRKGGGGGKPARGGSKPAPRGGPSSRGGSSSRGKSKGR